MFYVDSKDLTSGMYLARDIHYFDNDTQTMSELKRGERLTDMTIGFLKAAHVEGAYISRVAADTEMTHTINDELKNQAVNGIQSLAKGFMGGHITGEQIEDINNTASNLVETVSADNDVMVNILDLKMYDDYTYHHSLSVAVMSLAVGMEFGFDKNTLGELVTAALLHDIGKIAIPITIINKPSRLTAEEFEVVKKHPIIAGVHLRKNNFVTQNTFMGIVGHHEKWNGTGYPNGLEGKNIHMFARIMAVADVFDALTSHRPYRKPAPTHEVLEYIMANAGTHFDEEIVRAFLKRVAPFPVGSHVRLSNGKRGIVIKNYREQPLRPLIAIIDEDISYDLFQDPKYFNLIVTGVEELDNISVPPSNSRS